MLKLSNSRRSHKLILFKTRFLDSLPNHLDSDEEECVNKKLWLDFTSFHFDI